MGCRSLILERGGLRWCSLAAIGLLIASPAIWAQNQTKPSAPVALSLPAQKIGPNDLLTVAVYDCPEISRAVRVGADGGIQLPLLKQKVQATGLMPEQLEHAVASALVQDGLVVDPVVTITVLEYQGRPITVAGEVRNPTTFQAIGEVTLLEAIGRAGGLTANAGPEIYVTRSAAAERSGARSDDPPATRTIPVKELLDARNPALNIALTAGDEVRVPSAGKVFVVGNVKKPGAYRLDDATETSVLKILAVAEGVLPFTSNEAYLYRLDGRTNQRAETLVQIRKILDRKAPDVSLRADDIFYVPDNKGRRATLNALERVISFGAATTSGVLVYRGIR